MAEFRRCLAYACYVFRLRRHKYILLSDFAVRDLEAARERCARSLELNAEQPAAVMLLALIFTAEADLKVPLHGICVASFDIAYLSSPYIQLQEKPISPHTSHFQGALELVVNALKDFPTHYGLLVLRLHIETKFGTLKQIIRPMQKCSDPEISGRIDESLDTCSHLLDFWRKRECCVEDERVQLTLGAADGQSMLKDASSMRAG